MRAITLGPDENGWTYTLTAKSGMLVGNTTLDAVYSYRRKGNDYVFQCTPPDKREIVEKTKHEPPYENIIVERTKSQQHLYGGQKESFTKFKLYLYKNDKCFIRKFRIATQRS